MSKTKQAFTNNEVLVGALGKALNKGLVKREDIKEYEKRLKSMFPNVHYDFSTLYKTEEEEN